MSEKLLTIAIPTYNRSAFLDRCLKSIYSQIGIFENDIEILVSNNASTDITEGIVNSHRNIVYVKNESNVGPDLNIAQCFSKASGKYVWIFGDDDVIVPGSINQLMMLLKQEDYGVIFVSPSAYSEDDLANFNNERLLDYKVYDNSIKFFEKVSYSFTLISSNIINKSVVPNVNYSEFAGTYLIQLSWTLRATFAAKKNVYVNSIVIACEQDNSGGYKYLEVFSKNYNSVMKSLVSNGIDERIIPITNNEIINRHLPHFINKLLYKKNEYIIENGFFTLLSCYWDYQSFWKIIFPIYAKYWLRKMKLLKKIDSI